jgi:hypothetical protein
MKAVSFQRSLGATKFSVSGATCGNPDGIKLQWQILLLIKLTESDVKLAIIGSLKLVTASLFDLIQGVSEICLVKIFFDNINDTVLPINNVCIFFKILQWTNPLFDFKDLFINWHGCSDLQVKYLGS